MIDLIDAARCMEIIKNIFSHFRFLAAVVPIYIYIRCVGIGIILSLPRNILSSHKLKDVWYFYWPFHPALILFNNFLPFHSSFEVTVSCCNPLNSNGSETITLVVPINFILLGFKKQVLKTHRNSLTFALIKNRKPVWCSLESRMLREAHFNWFQHSLQYNIWTFAFLSRAFDSKINIALTSNNDCFM